MDEIRQPATIANNGIVFLSASDRDEKEKETESHFICYYYQNKLYFDGGCSVTL